MCTTICATTTYAHTCGAAVNCLVGPALPTASAQAQAQAALNMAAAAAVAAAVCLITSPSPILLSLTSPCLALLLLYYPCTIAATAMVVKGVSAAHDSNSLSCHTTVEATGMHRQNLAHMGAIAA